jgi:hypothetical protein
MSIHVFEYTLSIVQEIKLLAFDFLAQEEWFYLF